MNLPGVNIRKAWVGNLASDRSRFLCDGHSMVVKSAVGDEKVMIRLRDKRDPMKMAVRPKGLSPHTVSDAWKTAINASVLRDVKADRVIDDRLVILSDGTAVSAHKFAYVHRFVPYDRLRKGSDRDPLVFLKDGKSVALISPIYGHWKT